MSSQDTALNSDHDNKKEIMHIQADAFLYTHAFSKVRSHEHFISENILAFQTSGISHVTSEEGEMTMKEGQLILARRDQLAKYTKIPTGEKHAHCICVILTIDQLQKFALENDIDSHDRYTGDKLILMESNDLLRSFFSSVMCYEHLWNEETQKLASLKVNEIIEILLLVRPELKSFLFDFADPNKQDLETFMLKNFRYNVSLEQLAKLSGRSLTSFKREFMQLFKTSPANWIKNKRLSEAYSQIKEKGLKPDDFYYDLGFVNLSHFYTAFKQRYGMTPSEINSGKQNNLEKLSKKETAIEKVA
jgi:AraC-like DNA-binding protein